jgi:hypothetical protein
MLSIALFGARVQKASLEYKASGNVTDMVVSKGFLYASTDASCVDVFELKSAKVVKKIKIEQIKDFTGEVIDAKIFAVDIIDGKILILSQGLKGYNRVYLYENDKLRLLVSDSDELAVSKAKFLDKDRLLFALISDEIISYNIKNKKVIYRVAASASTFSDFVLSEDKTKVVVADESGDLQLLSTKDGSHLKSFTGQNLDNVFQVDYKKGIIVAAGKDRRVVVYDTLLNSSYYKTSHFFIYSAGLSPSASIVAYSSDVNNNVTLFNRKTKSTLGLFSGNRSTLSKILFLNEKEFLVSGASKKINLYKLK